MGKKNNRHYKNKRKGNQEKRSSQPYEDRYVLTTTEHGNFKMEAYYALQALHDTYYNDEGKLVKCETDEERNEERLRWRKSMTSVLPSSFRIAYDVSESLKQTLEAELEALIPTESLKAKAGQEEDKKAVLKKLPFLPHAYQISVDKSSMKKDPATEKLHLWLKQQTLAGFVTRQETVSMIPPVVLAPEADDVVFDMCAAPGSKTCQILEKLSDRGAIIANDSNSQRAYTLVTQLRRIMYNNPVVLVTSCEAQFFPQSITFDRVLADVPCSGDGTSRKNIGIWKQWNQLGALALHSLQVDIAWKGAALLKVGGCFCYSTCSQNPVEDEAVVAELLRRANGSLELVNTQLNGLKTRPGMSTWKVVVEDKSNRQMKNEKKKNNAKMRQRREEFEKKQLEVAAGTGVESSAATEQGAKEGGEQQPEATGPRRFQPPDIWTDEALLDIAASAGLRPFKSADEVPEHLKKRIRASCFPPTQEEAERFHLDKCVRCLPHDNDTGGFFTALLKKVAPLSNKEARTATNAEQGEKLGGADDGPESKRLKPNVEAETNETNYNDAIIADEIGWDEDLPAGDDSGEAISERTVKNGSARKRVDLSKDNFVPADPSIFNDLIEHYGLKDDFPKNQYMTRMSGDAKNIFYIGKSCKENFLDKGIQDRLTVINSGIKGFVRNNKEANTAYRMCQEGIHFLVPYMTKGKISVGPEDFNKCLDGSGTATQLSECSDEFAEQARPLSVGAFVVLLKGYETDMNRKMMLTMWRCRGDAINCLVNKVEVDGMKSKLAAIKEEQAAS